MTILEKANQILADKEANLLPENLRQGKTCLGVNGTLIELVGEEQTVIATTEEQEILPTEGCNGITKMIVKPVTSAVDVNIKTQNIKAGVSILGIEGSYEGEILTYPAIDNLPTDAEEGLFGIVKSDETYVNSTYDTVFENRVHLPQQVVFENNPGEFSAFIGLLPQDGDIIINTKTGSLTSTGYSFILNCGEDTGNEINVTYTSTDGLVYVRDSVIASGMFSYDDDTGIITSTIPLIGGNDDSLVDVYDTTGGLFLQDIVESEYLGLYQFNGTEWVRIDLDTSDANATTNDIVVGATAYVNGEKIEGSVSKVGGNLVVNANDVQLFNDTNTIWFSHIYDEETHPNGVMYPVHTWNQIETTYANLAEKIGLTADKIKSGETVLGITGTYTGEVSEEPNEGEVE